MKVLLIFIAMAVVLVAAAFFFPQNSLTGNAVTPCDDCVRLCDTDDQCLGGMVCCATSWESGVCDAKKNCDGIAAYSRHESLDSYQPVPEQDVHVDWQRFFLPILVTVGICIYVFRRKT